MYTRCTIRFVDDGCEYQDVIIKAYDSFDENDDEIFFYGLSRRELEEACQNGTVVEGEWVVLSVGETWD